MKRNSSPEGIEKTIRELDDCVLIVEGVRDEQALKTLGLKNITRISGVPFIKAVENIKKLRKGTQEVVILTDFDYEGRKLAKRLAAFLKAYKIHPNSRKRSRIMELGKTHIENLRNINSVEAGVRKAVGSRLKRPFSKEDDFNVKISTNINKISYKGRDKSRRCRGETRRHRRDIRSD